MSDPNAYRDRVHIVKDIISILVQYGELNQTALVSYCGLNITKHKRLLDEIESKNLITRVEGRYGKRSITIYKLTQDGLKFFRDILEPYEIMFPRKKIKEEKDST